MGRVLVGTAGWADRTLIQCGRFYPRGTSTAEARLRHYASVFPLVEVDSTYYALPSEANAQRWAERTPPGFVFDVKAFSLLTGHPTRPEVLPRDLAAELPKEVLAKRDVYPDDLPAALVDEVFTRFRSALGPLRDAGKLGSILLQFPPWLEASRHSANVVAKVARRLAPLDVAIELRHGSWLSPEYAERTRAFLEREHLPFVCVDMPQGFDESLPPLPLVTSPRRAVVRFHGRNRATFTAKVESAAERFRWLYTEAELSEWTAKIEEIAERTEEVHVIMNNCYQDYAVTNARDVVRLLAPHGATG
jgi:uncharacterized protein YecE (DUF72 family)